MVSKLFSNVKVGKFSRANVCTLVKCITPISNESTKLESKKSEYYLNIYSQRTQAWVFCVQKSKIIALK